jgi:metal-responsive CopG/Arc/MetJ family transcriptional regulator
MSRAVKVAVSLPSDLFKAAERERRAIGDSRSEFFRRALETVLRRHRERESIRQYVEGYRTQPETGDEVAAIHQVSGTTLAQDAWE